MLRRIGEYVFRRMPRARQITRSAYRRIAYGPLIRTPLAVNRLAYDLGLWQQSRRLGGARTLSGPAEIEVKEAPELPPLAWICVRRNARFHFTTGAGVETFSTGVFEGVWDGEFDEFSEIATKTHFGSGATFGRDVTFIPPKHALEYLFVLRDKASGTDHISNSLCFCLASAGVRRGSEFFDAVAAELVEGTHIATRRGIYRYEPLVVGDGQFALFRMMHNNFRIRANGNVEIIQPYTGRRFAGFRDYRAYLGGTVGRLLKNAADPLRRRVLSPLTALSSGYDSPAVAALAAEVGCRHAATLAFRYRGADDSGAQIGRALGLEVREYPHILGNDLDRLSARFCGDLKDRSLEFIATAGIGDDITFLAFEPILPDRVLLTGAWGDSIWSKRSAVRPGLPVRIRYGKSITEYRLRIGFAHIPVPVIGAMYPNSILAISNSPEMKHYSIGGDYDRPIPRRIAEEAGVERGQFGNLKAATAPTPIDHAELWPEAVSATMLRYENVALD